MTARRGSGAAARSRVRPARLTAGSRVAVVAPAGPVPAPLLDAGVSLLRDWGLRVTVGAHVLDRDPALDYLAGTDADRAAEFQRVWCSPTVDAVFCARGGYGSLRVLDTLDWPAMAEAIRRNGPKLFTGSSDLTALHQAIGDRMGLATVFGPMVATKTFVCDHVAREHLRRTLFEPESVCRLSGAEAGTLVPGRARGVLVGGNASMLAACLGDPALTPPDGALALLEDITEDPYRLDRILVQLRRAGWFDGVRGIALGSWTQCGDTVAVRAVLTDTVGSLGLPTVWELGFGHCARALTVPLGVTAELDADAGTLTLDEPALR
ncbi:MAG: S66 peptidase family protein [Sciscionella sp.]